jgi:hypothetical protein
MMALGIGPKKRAANVTPLGTPQSNAKLRLPPAQSFAAGSEHEPRGSAMVGSTATGCSLSSGTGFLDRRAGHVAIGTEHATVPRLGLEDCAAVLAVIEILTGIGRHGFPLTMTAGRTG